jgi:hypothetical protein
MIMWGQDLFLFLTLKGGALAFWSIAAIMLTFVGSLVLRLVLQFWFNYQGDPWSYRFFPSEFAVFLIGALAYRVYKLPAITLDRPQFGIFAVAVVGLGTTLLINRWNGPSLLHRFAFG